MFKISQSLSIWQHTKGIGQKLWTIYPQAIKFFLSAIFIIIVILAAYELVRYDLTIEAFHIPEQLAKQGYSGKVVAYQLGEQIQLTNLEITSPLVLKQQEKASWLPQELQKPTALVASSPIIANQQAMTMQFQGLGKAQNIDVPGIGLSLDIVMGYLSGLLGIKQNRVYGELIEKNNAYEITIRMTGRTAHVLQGTDVNELIKKAGKYVARTLAPLPIGIDYCFDNTTDSLKELGNLILELKNQLDSTDEDRAIIFTLLGCWLKNLQEYDNALASLEKAELLHSDNPINHIISGDILMAYGDKTADSNKYQQAIKHYELAVQHRSTKDSLAVYSRLAQAYIKLDQKHQAFAIYEHSLKNSSFTQQSLIYANWGNILLRDEPEAAIVKYQQALKANPAYYIAYAFWGDALYRMNDYAQAAEKYSQALRINADNDNYAAVYANLGEAWLKQNLYEPAINAYQQALKLNPNISWVYGNWGYALQKQQQYEQAINVYKQGAKIGSLGAWILRDWREALEQLGKPDLEFLHYYAAYNATYGERTPASIYGDWADTLRKLGRYVEALEKYQLAIESMALANNNYKSIMYANWGYTLSLLGRYDEAEQQYKLAKLVREQMGQVLYDWVYAFWGDTLQKQEKYKEALQIYQEADEKHAKLPLWMLNAWGNVLKKLDYPHRSLLIYYASYVKTNPNRASTYHAWGNVLRAINEFQAALPKYEQAIVLTTDNQDYCQDWCSTIAKLPSQETEIITDARQSYELTYCAALNPCLAVIDSFGEITTGEN